VCVDALGDGRSPRNHLGGIGCRSRGIDLQQGRPAADEEQRGGEAYDDQRVVVQQCHRV